MQDWITKGHAERVAHLIRKGSALVDAQGNVSCALRKVFKTQLTLVTEARNSTW